MKSFGALFLILFFIIGCNQSGDNDENSGGASQTSVANCPLNSVFIGSFTGQNNGGQITVKSDCTYTEALCSESGTIETLPNSDSPLTKSTKDGAILLNVTSNSAEQGCWEVGTYACILDGWEEDYFYMSCENGFYDFYYKN